MACPFLEEVVMVFCRAYPVKKLIPRGRSLAASRCLSGGFDGCPFFQEVTAPAETAGLEASSEATSAKTGKA